MAQPEMPQGAAAEPDHKTPGRMALPDTRGALPIPDHFRLPFKGKEATPTSVPSGTQRRFNLEHLKKKKRRRAYLGGLLIGQILILGLSIFGDLWLLEDPLAPRGRAASLVLLGVGALGVLLVPAAGVYLALVRSRVAKGTLKTEASARSLRTVLFLSLGFGLLLATAWFMNSLFGGAR